VKQSSEQLVVRVINREMDPVQCRGQLPRRARKWIELGPKTNAFGEVAFSNPEGILDGKLVIKVEPGQATGAGGYGFSPHRRQGQLGFRVTDRPIFKPGESFFYKGVVRGFENGELKVPDIAEKQASVTLIRTDGTPTDLHALVPVTGFGSFSGGFDLDENQTRDSTAWWPKSRANPTAANFACATM